MKWVQSFLNKENKGKWKGFFDYHLERYGGKLLFSCNLNKKDASQLKIKNPVFESTCICHNSLITIMTKSKVGLKLSYPTQYSAKKLISASLKKASTQLKRHGKWLADDSIGNETVNWESTYSLPFWIFGVLKKQNWESFSSELLHTRIATNDFSPQNRN